MFYCDPCREKNGWPESLSRSRGLCEICRVPAVCNDVKSSQLPPPGRKLPAPAVPRVVRTIIVNEFSDGTFDVITGFPRGDGTVDRPSVHRAGSASLTEAVADLPEVSDAE